MNQTKSLQSLQSIVDKLYEHRLQHQHAFLTQFLSPFFPTLSANLIKLISFYIRKIEGPQILTNKQYTSLSFVINGINQQNPENVPVIEEITKEKKVVVKEGKYALFLNYADYLNCKVLGETSIEQQISFMHSSEFLCSIPRKRFYYILRNSKVLSYSMFQTVYFEGQKIQPGQSGSGIYLVRKGQFGYFKTSEKEGKQIETYRFGKGHLFGTLQLSNGNGRTYDQPKRAFSLKCKSSRGIVYNFNEQIFSSHVKPYCQQTINMKQEKLQKYLRTHMNKMDKVRQGKSSFLSQTLTRGFSQSNNNMNYTTENFSSRNKPSLPTIDNFFNKTRLSQQLEEESMQKTQLMWQKKEGPLKNYPMASRRSNFTETEFRELQKLERNKEQCQKLKHMRGNKMEATKGQILFEFFKNSWAFNKERRLRKRGE